MRNEFSTIAGVLLERDGNTAARTADQPAGAYGEQDSARSLRPPRSKRRGHGERLAVAIEALARDRARILHHRETAWASITFSGTRHDLTLLFEDSEAIEAGEAFLAELPDHEFALPGQLVADAAILEVDHRMEPCPRMQVTVSLLLLDES